ncbi:hypothetical protein C8J57DRAFT_1228334 [Mycena rebaudengoi]|nr:hypothetical protein C8J57DRAFT_1228334 [Mycena rebaudengoi]
MKREPSGKRERRVGEAPTDCTQRVLGVPERKLGARCEKVPSYKGQVSGGAIARESGAKQREWECIEQKNHRRSSQKSAGKSAHSAEERGIMPSFAGTVQGWPSGGAVLGTTRNVLVSLKPGRRSVLAHVGTGIARRGAHESSDVYCWQSLEIWWKVRRDSEEHKWNRGTV